MRPCLVGIGVPFARGERAMERDGVDGCWTLIRHFRALNCILKRDKVAEFVMTIFITIK